MRKKIKILFWSPLTNRYNSQLSFGCTHRRVHWGHAHRHGKRSMEMLTAERAGYTQEMDCHYFNSWSVHRWSICKSCLVLMCRLNIVVFGIFATFGVSWAWTGKSRADYPSNRFYFSLATRIFPILWIKTVFCYCILTNARLLIVQFTDLVSNRF